MIGLGFVYMLAGLTFAGFAFTGMRNRANTRRFVNAAFWGLMALSFLCGDRLGDTGNGLLVLVLVAVATFGLGRDAKPSPALAGEGGNPSRSDGRDEGLSSSAGDNKKILTQPSPAKAGEGSQVEAVRHGNGLFLTALVVPAVALGGTLLFSHTPTLVDPKQATLVALAFGVLLGLALCFAWLQPRLLAPLEEGRRLMDAVGWAAVLPQMLSALGALFAVAGVGDVIGGYMGPALPHDSLVAAVVAYGLGMALLTMVMGNAFAAFPVMMAAVGLPLLIRGQHGNAAAVASIGMLTGFCGTLLTPLAANFNLVPAALLELPNRYGVIRAQAPTALLLFAVNLLLLRWLAFP